MNWLMIKVGPMLAPEGIGDVLGDRAGMEGLGVLALDGQGQGGGVVAACGEGKEGKDPL